FLLTTAFVGSASAAPDVLASNAKASEPLYSLTDLGTLGGTPDSYSVGLAINNSGQVTGYSAGESTATHAFLYDKGRMIDLGTFGSGSFSIGYAINDAGQVVVAAPLDGYNDRHTFIYKNGSTADIGANIEGSGINNSGQVTGVLFPNNSYHAFFYSRGATVDLGTLGGTTSFGTAINNSGQIVGYSTTPSDEAIHAFSY